MTAMTRPRPASTRWLPGLLPLCLCLTACASAPPVAGPAAEAAAGTPAAAAQEAANPTALPLPQGSQRYRFSWDGQLEGSATRSLSCQQDDCSLRTEASVPGMASLNEVSRFRWQDGQVRFEDYQRNILLLFLPQNVRISRQNGQIVTERKGKQRSYADAPDLIDTLGLEAQLRADLVRGGKPRARYRVAEVKEPVEVTLEELPGEKLTLAGRELDTRVFRRRSADGARETTLWLDPAQSFLPVQVVHKDEGNTYRLVWAGPVN